jgi:hypothetical protein
MSAALFSKSGSFRSHVALDPLRLEAVLAPYARHHHVADIQMFGKVARRPVRRVSRCVTRGLQNPRFQLRRGQLAGQISRPPILISLIVGTS